MKAILRGLIEGVRSVRKATNRMRRPVEARSFEPAGTGDMKRTLSNP